jgi:hypothetical protein
VLNTYWVVVTAKAVSRSGVVNERTIAELRLHSGCGLEPRLFHESGFDLSCLYRRSDTNTAATPGILVLAFRCTNRNF